MADFPITENPQLKQTMEQFTDNTPGDYNIFNQVWQVLLDNDNATAQVRRVILPADGWSAAVPYTQTLAVAGITAADTPVMSIYLGGAIDSAQVKEQSKAYGCLDRAVTGDRTITFYCYNKKPAADFIVAVKGV